MVTVLIPRFEVLLNLQILWVLQASSGLIRSLLPSNLKGEKQVPFHPAMRDVVL